MVDYDGRGGGGVVGSPPGGDVNIIYEATKDGNSENRIFKAHQKTWDWESMRQSQGYEGEVWE